MTTNSQAQAPTLDRVALSISERFIDHYPQDAARKLEAMGAKNAIPILFAQPEPSRFRVWQYLNNVTRLQVLRAISEEDKRSLLLSMDLSSCVQLLTLLEPDERGAFMALLPDTSAGEIRELLDYPANTAGRIMDTKIMLFHESSSVGSVLEQIKENRTAYHRRIYITDKNNTLKGQVDIESLFFSDATLPVERLLTPVQASVSPLDPVDEVAEQLSWHKINVLPVIDVHGRLLGVIRGAGAIEALQGDMAGDLQSMVGASREERALSSSWFAVKKRQGWLQINLLTGFLAASVVSLFEGTISQFTALAILMPIAAGQSGNTGAQALAVTMRGLTLREVTTRHWFRVMAKEAGAGVVNGIAVAITCAIGVFFWSDSTGLALVIALAMVISMTIAGIAGALVPIVLKKLGQDPAQSSSIILTTVTDVTGFMSFLGIAALLSNLLVAS
mgnify:CR=1 FL=1